MEKEKKIIYLVCLLFIFSWRANEFFKQKKIPNVDYLPSTLITCERGRL